MGRFMMEEAQVSARDMLRAMGMAQRTGADLEEVVVADGLAPRSAALDALAIEHAAPVVSRAGQPPDPTLAGLLEPEFCLTHRLLPWRREGTSLLIATSQPERFRTLKSALSQHLGAVRMALAQDAEIEALIAERHGPEMALAAENWLPFYDSCRDIVRMTPRRLALTLLGAGSTVAVLAWRPEVILLGLILLALASLVLAQLVKALSFVAGLVSQPIPDPRPPRHYPLVSLLVPLRDETDIAGTLVKRLSDLRYPKAKLEALLVLEAGDEATQTALACTVLPPWMRVIEVPPGSVTTKPRALNYALRFAKGTIIGIYDAEDAPAPDQIDRIVARFETAPPEVGCLQGMLDFYNSQDNWVSRCFAIEYASWFRILLPGLARLGFAIPLGGTSVFFRRAALDQVRGWDSHNVTEDADLGVRLARHGYRTEIVATVTKEEANHHVWPWIRQRSRWLKGYMMTYLVHMRSPARLWQQLGPWKFLGVQLVFLTAILQFTLAPVLWSFWLIQFGLPHAFATWSAPALMQATVGLFLTSELVALLVGFAAVNRTRAPGLMIWVPCMMIYYPLGVFAAYKALWEVLFRPYFWDKTRHGQSVSATRHDSGPAQQAPDLTLSSR